MGEKIIMFRVRGDAIEDVAKSIAADERWRQAEKEGLLEKRVLIDPALTGTLVLDTRWESIDALRTYETNNAGAFDFGDDIEKADDLSLTRVE